jgi:hypothetical protein
MWRDLERRLARAEMASCATGWVDRQAAHHRQSLRARVECHELVRERFRAMEIDPALAVTLRRGEEAAAELAAIPDTPDLKAADKAILRPEYTSGNDGARRVGARIARMAEQYRSGQHRLDIATASPAELLAFCVAVEMERGDEMSGSAGRDQRRPAANA